MKDPSVRMDGKCRQCKGSRTIPNSLLVDQSFYERDPFCSSQCCRLWHGIRGHVTAPVVCSGCGCDMEHVTPECGPCKSRDQRRRNRSEERVAA